MRRQDIRELALRRIEELYDQMYAIGKPLYLDQYPLTRFPETPSDAFCRAVIRVGLEQTYRETPTAAGKWTRGQLTSAQLPTYFVGYLEHVALRREVEESAREDFDLNTYHDKVISFGSTPPLFARALALDKPIPY